MPATTMTQAAHTDTQTLRIFSNLRNRRAALDSGPDSWPSESRLRIGLVSM